VTARAASEVRTEPGAASATRSTISRPVLLPGGLVSMTAGYGRMCIQPGKARRQGHWGEAARNRAVTAMLAAMSSLASLAHGARVAAPAFNGLFYATAATIIPVLFLAIAVQGPLYGDLLKASDATLRRFREHKAGASPRRLVLRLWIGSVLASSAAVAILIVTVGGEVEALVSLRMERAYGDPQAAIAAAVLLTAAAAVGPALAFARLMVTLYPRRGKSGSTSPLGEADDLHRDGRLPLAEPQSGKTDTEG
jgi:hypothetical protein